MFTTSHQNHPLNLWNNLCPVHLKNVNSMVLNSLLQSCNTAATEENPISKLSLGHQNLEPLCTIIKSEKKKSTSLGLPRIHRYMTEDFAHDNILYKAQLWNLLISSATRQDLYCSSNGKVLKKSIWILLENQYLNGRSFTQPVYRFINHHFWLWRHQSCAWGHDSRH